MECTLENISIYYEEIGSGRPIIMLHGWPLDHRSIYSDMEPIFLERKGWKRIYPDLPGMGRTPGGDWIKTQDHMLKIIIEFIDKVIPNENFIVVGNSYGGYLARGLIYHRSTQIDGVLMNVPRIEPNDQKANLPKHRILRDDKEFLEALQPNEEGIKEMVVVQSMDLLHTFRNSIFPAMNIADDEFLKRLHKLENYTFTFNVDFLKEPFPAPTLILTGRYDQWCGYREAYQILDNFPRGTFIVMDCAGHALSIEQKSLFRALVGEWLNRVEEFINISSL